MKTRGLLTVIIVLQGLILLGQWTGGAGWIDRAEAQIPDAGAQRLAMLQELRNLNGKLDEISSLLSSGQLQVRVPAADSK